MSINFIDGQTVITADWLNAVDSFVFEGAKTVVNIAELKTIDKTEFTLSFVRGYFTSGDGGGGYYFYDATDTTSVDNGGTIIVANDGGRWKYLHPREITVKTFGAGFGASDDSARLTAALTHLATYGGVLDFIGATVNITNRVAVAFSANVNATLKGNGGKISSTVAETGFEVGAVQFTGTSSSVLLVDNLVFTHNASSLGTIDTVRIVGFGNLRVTDIQVYGGSYWGLKVEDCLVFESEGSIYSNNKEGGLGFAGCATVLVTGGEANSNGNTLTINGYGISGVTGNVAGQDNTNVTITGVYCKNNLRNGIDCHNGTRVVITGCHVVGFGNIGIYAVNESTTKEVKDVIISNNQIEATNTLGVTAALYGIWVGASGTSAISSGHFSINNNQIRNISSGTTSSSAFGVYVTQGTGSGANTIESVNISFNSFTNACGSVGSEIRVENGSVIPLVTVTGNISTNSGNALAGIYIRSAGLATITSNQFYYGSGVVTYTVYVTNELGNNPSAMMISNSFNHASGVSGFTNHFFLGGTGALTIRDNQFCNFTSQGSFTLSAASSTVVNNPLVWTYTTVFIFPTNAAAATLMQGTKSLYISAKTAKTSFTVTTADGTAAVGTETFGYVLQ